jgi:hypothetical protein
MTGDPTGTTLGDRLAGLDGDADANEATETTAKIPTSAIFLSM